jgi:hypothetical protein
MFRGHQYSMNLTAGNRRTSYEHHGMLSCRMAHHENQSYNRYSRIHCPREDTTGGLLRFYHQPIAFEDGMGFEEIQIYYACLESQAAGGAVTRARLQGHHPTRRERCRVTAETAGSRSSCLRKSTKLAMDTTSLPRQPQRRSSFTSSPIDLYGITTLNRSNSLRCMKERTQQVAFDQFVQVATILSHRDYSGNTWSKLWMSRSELRECKRRGIVERRKSEKSPGSSIRGLHSVECADPALTVKTVERTPSIDSIIGELMLFAAMLSY